MGNEETEVEKLRDELAKEQRKSKALAEELRTHRELLVKNSLESEVEEECIINKLTKKLQQLAQEKERLALEVEREEELISNTLQKQLAQLRKDKVDLENQMEQEQECMVNKLQRQVSVLERQNADLSSKRHDDMLSQHAFLEECTAECETLTSRPFDPSLAQQYFEALQALKKRVDKQRLRRPSALSVSSFSSSHSHMSPSLASPRPAAFSQSSFSSSLTDSCE